MSKNPSLPAPQDRTEPTPRQEECGYYAETTWTWRDRLHARLFPSQPCPLPTAPAHFADVVECTTIVSLSVLDRLRVLLTGTLHVRTRTVTEHVVGGCVTSSVAYPLLRKPR